MARGRRNDRNLIPKQMELFSNLITPVSKCNTDSYEIYDNSRKAIIILYKIIIKLQIKLVILIKILHKRCYRILCTNNVN